jgi:hypothetical protein
MSQTETEGIAGNRAVLLIVGLSVGIVSTLGYVIGVFGPATRSVGQVGPITFPVTPVTLATYGLVMTSVGLGIFVALVAGTVYYINSKEETRD